MNSVTGILITLLSAVSYGTLGIFGKLAYMEGISTTTLLFFRFSLTGIFLMGLTFFRRLPFPRGKVLWILILMGSIGFSGQAFAYLSALKYANAGVVAILLSLYPAFVSILTIIVLKKKVSNIAIFGVVISFFGTILIADPSGGGNPLGFILGIAAALIYSTYIIIGSRVMNKVGATESTAVIFSSAAVVYFFLWRMEGAPMPATPMAWWVIAGMVAIPTIIASVTFLEGLKRVGAVNASIISTVEPLVTVLLAYLLFGEQLGIKAMVGGLLILTAVIIFTLNQKGQE